MSKGISPIRGRSLQSERNNDFSPETAIAEIIDNSIEANSKNIKIRIDSKIPLGKNVERPFVIAFGDDGDGMNEKVLQECLVLGESTRFNSRKGIGRFGVGMTKGAISICNNIEVYSRPHQGNWNYVQLNLKDTDDYGDPFVSIVKEKPLPDEFRDLVGDKGTLVIWSDIDRIESGFKISKLRHGLGRIFRKFIGNNIIQNKEVIKNPNKVTFTIDENKGSGHEEVDAFDPLYVIPDPKKPNESTAELLDDWEVEVEIGEFDLPDLKEVQGKVRFRFSFTPEEWRPIRGSGNSTENRSRFLPKNEGISILRKNREVAYKHVPNWSPVFGDIDRFWSCEIDFDPVLDHRFRVNNIKIGASPLKEMREFLQTQINPTRKKHVTKVQKLWSENKAKTITDSDKIGGDHDKGESNEEDVIKPNRTEPLSPEEEKTKEIELKKRQISEKETREILERIQDPKSPPILIHDSLKALPSADFIEIDPIGGKTITWLNLNHKFFQSVYDKIKNLSEMAQEEEMDKDRLVEIAADLKVDIDNLIIAFTDSVNQVTKTDDQEKISITVENLLMGWSRCLTRLYKGSSN